MNLPEQEKLMVDGISAAAVVAAIMDYVPATTAVLSLIWVCIRLWETETVKKLTRRWKRDEG